MGFLMSTTCILVTEKKRKKLFEVNQDVLEKRLGHTSSNGTFIDISYDTLKMAAEMFIYMHFCPEDYLNNPKNLDLIDILKKSSLEEILLFLNRLKTKSTDAFRDVAVNILEKLSDLLPLQYKLISMLLMENHVKDDIIDNVTLIMDIPRISSMCTKNLKANFSIFSTKNQHQSSSLER